MKKSLKGNNKGSSIVTVLIAVAFIGMLATVILWMSFTNYKMKINDRKNKMNFYSAETVLDQIRAGLQEEVSSAFEKAYAEVMQKYNKEEQAVREQNFKNDYFKRVRTSLKQEDTDKKYDINHLISYVKLEVMENATVEITSSEDYNMPTYEDRIVLRGIHVSYTNAQNYTSIIDTDIRLALPDLDFTETSLMPDIFKFCIIANNQLSGNNTGTDTKFLGSVYGGTDGIKISGASKWNFQNAGRIITDETVQVDGGEAELDIDANNALWARNIVVNEGKLNLKGKAYIADDLTIKGEASNVVLQNEYYGYGSSVEKAEDSSSIIVNGTNTSIDMSKLDTLLLAGHAFIGSSKATSDAAQNKNENVLMGESLAIKSNQVAYLVPEECIGVSNGTVQYGKNPLTKSEYEQLVKDQESDAGFEEVSFKQKVNRLGVSLETYGASYHKVFSANNGSTLVYYYLVMSEENANRYFRDYHKVSQNSKFEQYTSFYVDGIQSNSDYTRLNLAGNMLIRQDEQNRVVSDTNETDAASAEALSLEEASFKDTFQALTNKLVTSGSEVLPEEVGKGVFANLILENELKTYLQAELGQTKILSTGEEQNALKAVLIDNKSGGNVYSYNKSSDKNIRLIIATGDVEISANFTGLILAGGNVTIKASSDVSIQTNEEELGKVLQCKATEDEMLIAKFFKNGGNYILNGTSITTNEVSDHKIKVSDLITYENWTKK